jgi:hypothetical protein
MKKYGKPVIGTMFWTDWTLSFARNLKAPNDGGQGDECLHQHHQELEKVWKIIYHRLDAYFYVPSQKQNLMLHIKFYDNASLEK